jgi:hypothetical protein
VVLPFLDTNRRPPDIAGSVATNLARETIGGELALHVWLLQHYPSLSEGQFGTGRAVM